MAAKDRFKMTKKGGWDIEPAAVCPAQMTPRAAWTPEQKLCWAMIEQVEHDLRRPEPRSFKRVFRRIRPSLREEALHYIYRPDQYWPTSFDNVCAQIGIDPDAYRSAIERKGQAA